MVRCSLCQSLGASHNDHDKSRSESLLDHAGTHNKQINLYAKTNIFKTFADCFPKIAAKYTIREMADSMELARNRGSNDSAEGKTRSVPSAIGAHCRQTLASYSRQQRRFECGICGTFITLRYGPKALVSTNLVLQHALAHMRIKPYRCRFCTVDTKRQSGMAQHLKNAHKLAATYYINYINEISVHEKKICEMITSCFGKKDYLTSGTAKSVKINLQRLQDTKSGLVD